MQIHLRKGSEEEADDLGTEGLGASFISDGLVAFVSPPFGALDGHETDQVILLFKNVNFAHLINTFSIRKPTGGKKRKLRASLEEEQPPAETQRKLRVRQQTTTTTQTTAQTRRIVSEESVCGESSDDVKLPPAARPVKTVVARNKRKGAGRSSTPSSVSSSQMTTPAESSDERGTLELFIPPPRDFRGTNNPFVSLELGRKNGGAPVNPYLSVRPPQAQLKTAKLSEKDIRITKNGEIKRKRSFVRQWKRSQEGFFNMNEPSGFSTTSTLQHPQKSSKESVLSYFGVEGRIARGEKYVVHAKRVGPDGRPQYLIQWETES